MPKAAMPIGTDSGHEALRRTAPGGLVFELARGGVKGVPDQSVELSSGLGVGLTSHHDGSERSRDVEMYTIVPPVPVVPVRNADDDVTAHDAIGEAFESTRALFDQ
jgi:hypothetical protein